MKAILALAGLVLCGALFGCGQGTHGKPGLVSDHTTTASPVRPKPGMSKDARISSTARIGRGASTLRHGERVDAYRSCDANISAKVGTTSCGYAENAFYEYWATRGAGTIPVYSPVTRTVYPTRCSLAGALVICTASDGGSVRFPDSAIDHYPRSLARAYAATHMVGARRPPLEASGAYQTEDGIPSSRSLASSGNYSTTERVCYPAMHLPAVHLPATHLPAVDLPAVRVGSVRVPAQRLPAQSVPGTNIPGQVIPGGCYTVPSAFALTNTTVRFSGYGDIDPAFSKALSSRYWSASPSVNQPDPTALGFGQLNAAGFPKNQYVRPYVRRDGTMVSGYWRNSPTDGLPTCHVITC